MVQKLVHLLKSNQLILGRVQLKRLDFFVLCLLLMHSVNLLAQSPRRFKVKTGSPNHGKIIFYGYIVNNDTIRHGAYKRYKGSVLIESGFFNNNLKDSVWNYYSQTKALLATGCYSKNEKTGIWEYFRLNGTLTQKYNHTTKAMLYMAPEAVSEQPGAYANLKSPIFIGGNDYMNSIIQNNVVYPQDAYKLGVSGKCFVHFVVDTLGTTTKVMVDADSDVRFAKAAVDVVTALGQSWIPGSIDGRLVPVSYIIPVSFHPE